MLADGRARPGARARVQLLPRLLCLHTVFTFVTSTDYGVPIEIKHWDLKRTPLSQMVDITNEFGLKVLAEHNFFNDNNIAFSPYGLTGILVALYEGVDGESSFQIQRGMHLPWNRNIMRIGFRDIHRTLKTYFVPEEGFLAGLALNNENVTFNDNYKKILRFYGFDLENDQLPTLPPGNETAAGNATNTSDKGPEPSTASMPENTSGQPTPPPREETTANPNAETLNEVDIRGPTTAMSPTSAANAESPPLETEPVTSSMATATQEPSTIPIIDTTTTILTTVTSTGPSTFSTVESSPFAGNDGGSSFTATMSSVTSVPDEPTVNNEIDTLTTQDATTTSPTQDATTTSPTQDATTTNPSQDATSTGPAETSAADLSTTMSVTTAASSTATEAAMTSLAMESEPPASTTVASTMPDLNTVANETTLETLERRKKSVVDFIFTNPPYIDDYLVYRSYDVGLELPIPNFDEKMFLVNGLRNVQVTYMHYDTVLEHAYLPHLEASALRLPLDSERYYLLVVLPSRAGATELGRLLSRMARESDLSDVYAALRPRRVRAVVPSFIVKGHVTLTTDLQKLGIRDVFEPRQQDFTPMTRQPGVYVRSIEQAVSVAIRKYRPDEQKKNRYVTNRQPVTFTATYPFLYFVMDSSIHVSLMAGKMVDPLNTRIL